jgi:hypothetical protein
MNEQQIRDTITNYVLEGLHIEDISSIEVSNGICWIEMHNKDVWFIDVTRAPAEEEFTEWTSGKA